MLRAIIIDDEQNGIDALKLLIESFINNVKIVAEVNDATLASITIDNYRPDIVFLDINMPKLNGFDVLNNLKYKNFSLIFTTAYEEYALKALKNNALDYLLKPIDIVELKTAISKAEKNVSNHVNQIDLNQVTKLFSRNSIKTCVNTKDEIVQIEIAQIIRIEGNGSYIKYYLKNGLVLESYCSMKETEDLLNADTGFMRVHQSHLINLNEITKYYKKSSGIVVMSDGCEIPVSRLKKDEVLSFLKL